MRFSHRPDAGRRLAERIGRLDWHDPMVLALGRGGAAVGAEIAEAMGLSLELMVVHRLHPARAPEGCVGALAEGGTLFVDDEAFAALQLGPPELAAMAEQAAHRNTRDVAALRGGRAAAPVRRRSVLLVDDGISAGHRVRAAIRELRERDAGRIAVAVPVLPADRVALLSGEADELLYLHAAPDFASVAEWYDAFPALADADVLALVERCRLAAASAPPLRLAVRIPVGDAEVQGDLTLPSSARGLVIFAHGSGSSRHSPRNQLVAQRLYEAGLATLLMDLLTEREEQQLGGPADLRFDLELLSARLSAATRWAQGQPATQGLPIGYFGASTGAAAALVAAAELPAVRAVVSRGGRPDLAGPSQLAKVRAPTLLIVGGLDREVLALNRTARDSMRSIAQLSVVPGATHLFEEPGTLEAVAELASQWFGEHLAMREHREPPRVSG